MNRASRRKAPHALRAAEAFDLNPANRAYAAAASAMLAGEIGRAKILYTRCLAADPLHIQALHDLGVVAARENQHDAAVARFERVIALEPDHADAWLNMALSLMRQRASSGSRGGREARRGARSPPVPTAWLRSPMC